MESRQRLESLLTFLGEMQPHQAMILAISATDDQTGLVRSIDESDHAVMPEQEIVRHLADGRSARICVAAYGQEELMLGGGEPSGAGLLLTPPGEVPQASAEGEQVRIVRI